MNIFFNDLKLRFQNLFEIFLYPHLNVRENYLTFIEAIFLTFPFLILSNLIWFLISISTYQSVLNDNIFFQMITQNVPGLVFFPLMASVVYMIFTLITYPLWSYFSYQMWSWVIRFYQKYMGNLIDDPTAGKDLAIASLSSNILLIFPFIGSQLAFVASLIQLLVGIHHRLKISYMSSFLIILTPLVLTIMFIFTGIFLFTAVLSTLF
ncbi:MAG: hypothetical protein QE271_08210 [Bacteriovoracaceae bacterium]|nr:hypothetical protein [Bacteriovoracaceae bacterium]